MTKAEYIAKYGKEKYEEHLEKKKAYYQVNRDKILENRKAYQNANKEKIAEYYKSYRESNKEKVAEYQKAYYGTKNGRAKILLKDYNQKDKNSNRDYSNNVSADWIIENVFSGQCCIYCGDSDWAHLGLDRIDNSKGHSADNVVCCCGICNAEKSDKYSVEEFKQYRQLHPRSCDIQKAPELNENGAISKRIIC